MDKGYTYDDIALVPQFNNCDSRLEPDLSTWLTKSLKIDIPIVNSPMDSVISHELATVLHDYGSIPIFHRFYKNFDDLATDFDFFSDEMFITSGVRSYDGTAGGQIKDTIKLCHYYGDRIKGLVIDIAHGHSPLMMNTIEQYKSHLPHLQIIAGNVCTPQGYQDLVNAGADAVRVGVGPGAACTTRVVTGFGVPQFSAIYNIAEVARKLRVPIIADGGIRGSADIIKALAAGAHCVMLGKLFAATLESGAEKKENYGRSMIESIPAIREIPAVYKSPESQTEFFGGVKDGTVPEGEASWIPVTGSAKDLIEQLLGGLRSGLTYGGARTIKELQRKAEFIEVTSNYNAESDTRF
jgi:IMP dehydrogenase